MNRKSQPESHRRVLDGSWTVDDAAQLYGLPDWGKEYFAVSPAGNVVATPTKDLTRTIDLHEVVQGLSDRGIGTPVLLRFSDIVDSRLKELRAAFDAAIAENEYQGAYSCIYPIKVNQQRHICEEIRDIGARLGFGLEAGSKPELLAVLGLTVGYNDMPIVCNGFKDSEFIETVILATKLGRTIIPVVERFSDLQKIIFQAKHYGVEPRIGLRIKPATRGGGKWQASAGVRSKFGLFASEALKALRLLQEHDMAHCLKMVHFHLGSQLSDIRKLKGAITELGYVYSELRKLGAGIDIIDVGGGLGVDYDGSNSSAPSSINYSIREYASDIVYRLKAVCDDAGVPHPTIFSESGRAMVAHSSVLVFDVLGASRVESEPDIARIQGEISDDDDAPQPLLDLLDAHERLNDRNLADVFHDAIQARDESFQLFSLGYLSLQQRADAEGLFWSIGHQVLRRLKRLGERDLFDDFDDISEALSDIYYCNFSVFQSLPDAWAIKQLFPIMPIHRLQDQPTRRATLADITCDSDGRVDRFVDRHDVKSMLEVHQLIPEEPYYLGIFLVGAYQETLGDLHNLYGDTNAVHISLDERGRWSLDEVVEGDRVRDVLGYVQFGIEDLLRQVRRDIERAVRQGSLEVPESRALLRFYEQGIDGYTYLE